MGMELRNEEFDPSPPSDDCMSDSEAIYEATILIRSILNSSAQGDLTQYNQLLSDINNYVDPVKEQLLVMILRALSGAISSINVNYHERLLSSVLGINLWEYGPNVADVWVQFVIDLVASNGRYLDDCLKNLVFHFLPPTAWISMFYGSDPKNIIKFSNLMSLRLISNVRTRGQLDQQTEKYLCRKEDVLIKVHMALEKIVELIPSSPLKLGSHIIQMMPTKDRSKEMLLIYLESLLKLESGVIGEYLRSKIWKAMIGRIVELDVDIRWEDIQKEDNGKNIFYLQLEDGGVDDDARTEMLKVSYGHGALDMKADKLDSFMDATLEHINYCFSEGRLVQVFEILVPMFQPIVLNTFKPKFAQFVFFYASSLAPKDCGEKFATILLDTYESATSAEITRTNAVAYLASYLSRARFLSSSFIMRMLTRLVRWCADYCGMSDARHPLSNAVHEVFYYGCQAILYILCFHMRAFMSTPELKAQVLEIPLNVILHHPLDPLKVCLPSIVEEFLKQARQTGMFSISKTIELEHRLDKSSLGEFGGVKRLDMFFPFDPYLLRKSDRFIRPNFNFWSLIETANTEGDDENPECSDEEFEEFEDDDGFEEFDQSMSKMSITPKSTLKSQFVGWPMLHEHERLEEMPAKLRPSTSPNW